MKFFFKFFTYFCDFLERETETMKRIPRNLPNPEDERKETEHAAQAEIFLQDAIDFMDNQEIPTTKMCTLGSSGPNGGGFVMEEDMLESDKQAANNDAQFLLKEEIKTAVNSAEPTSRQIKTNEVFNQIFQLINFKKFRYLKNLKL